MQKFLLLLFFSRTLSPYANVSCHDDMHIPDKANAGMRTACSVVTS